MKFSASEFEAAEPVFLLEIEWRGIVHRFAKVAIDIASNDGDLHYVGGLEDFEYKEVTDIVGINIEQDSISAALIFNDVDFVQEWRKGFVLDGSRAELSIVLFKNGAVQQTYEERQRLFVGYVSGSVFGDPLEPKGFVAFSIDAKPYDFEGKMLNPQEVISPKTMTDAIIGTDLRVWDDSFGKAYPFVFGYAGEPWIDGNGDTFQPTFCTPAYIIGTARQASERKYEAADCFLLIAGHRVDADKVVIRDQNYAYETLIVKEAVDNNGVLFSYVQTTKSTTLLTTPILTSSSGQSESEYEYWVQWGGVTALPSKNGGGALNSNGTGVLQLGGDVILHALRRTNALVDYAAWQAIKPLLDGYKFSGYVNDIEVGAWDWVQQNILKFLPVEARAGVDGLRPLVSLMFLQSGYLASAYHVIEGSDFELASAIEMVTELDDIVNDYGLKFVWEGKNDNAIAAHRVTAVRAIDSIAIDSTSYAWTSQNKYGVHKRVDSSYYIFDRDTAAKVCKDMVRSRAFAFRQFDCVANVKYGYLNVGDVIGLTSDTLYLNDAPVLIVAKAWIGEAWRFTLHIEDNPNTTEHTT